MHLYNGHDAARSYATWMWNFHGVLPSGLDSGTVPSRLLPYCVSTAEKQAQLWMFLGATSALRRMARKSESRGSHAPFETMAFELRGWEGAILTRSWVELSDSLIQDTRKYRAGHKLCCATNGTHGLVEMPSRAPRRRKMGNDVAELKSCRSLSDEQVVRIPSRFPPIN